MVNVAVWLVVGKERNRERTVEVEKGVGVIRAGMVVRQRREMDGIINRFGYVLGRHRAVGRFEKLVESCFEILLLGLHCKEKKEEKECE